MARMIAKAASWATLLALPAMIAASPNAQAQQSPSLLVVHGIEGADLGSNFLPSLPINLKIDGACVTVQPVQFGTASGPYPLTAGSHTVTISLANTTKPCSNAAVITQHVGLAAGQQFVLVAAESTSGAPAAEVYDLTEEVPVKAGTARVVVFHTANAPAVDISLTDNATGKSVVLSDLMPGGRIAGTVFPFTAYVERVMPTGTTTVVAGPTSFNAADRAVEALFVVGSAANSDVTVIAKEIPGVF